MRDASHAAPKGLQGRSLCVRQERRQLRVAIRVRRRRQAQSLTSGRLRHSRRDRQHLVDAAPVQIDDFESPAFVVKVFSHLRQMPELTDDEAGNGVEAALGRPCLEIEFDQRHPERTSCHR